jgi:SAM-dependent methyltransferase
MRTTDILSLLIRQSFCKQTLKRIPEPTEITDSPHKVEEYNRAMETNLAILYDLAIDLIYRVSPSAIGTAVDLACGPGHFTSLLNDRLGCDFVCGLDLSKPMIDTARKTYKNIFFVVDDITNIQKVIGNYTFLSCFTNSAHHMSSLSKVNKVLNEMERITRPDGLIFVSDLVRPKNLNMAIDYIHLVGPTRLPDFWDDFRNSVFAAWTVDELKDTLPYYTDRTWYQIVPYGFPIMQVLVGLPVGRKELFIRKGKGGFLNFWMQQLSSKRIIRKGYD